MAKIMEIATSMIAFSTFLGVLTAIISYINQVRGINLLEIILYTVIYISVNLLFLYVLVRWIK